MPASVPEVLAAWMRPFRGYFTDVLTRIVNGWPESRIDELMPWHWATAKEARPSSSPEKGL